MIATIIAFIIVGVVVWLFLKFTYFGEELREIESLSHDDLIQKLAEDFDFWNKVINSDDPEDPTNMSWSEHRDMPIKEKVDLIKREKMGNVNRYIEGQGPKF